MKPKTVILMVVAIGCGLTASYMTSRVIADRKTQESVEKVAVIVPKQNIVLGTLIKEPEKLFDEKMVSEDSVPKRAIRELAQLKGKMTARSLNAEAYIFPEDFMDKDRDTLSQGMPPGTRAVSLRVDAVSQVGGFVLPNSRVDIICVGQMNDYGDFATVLLQNVLVLAVDALPTRPDDKVAVAAQTVTVALTPEESAKIALASTKGRLQLALRGYGDEVVNNVKVVRPTDIIKTGGQAGDKEGTSGGEGSGATPSGPSTSGVPDVPESGKGQATSPKADDPSKGEATPETKADPEPAPEPPKTHILTIYNGEVVTRAKYLIDRDGQATVQVEKSDPTAASAPAPRTEPKAEPKPESEDDDSASEAKPKTKPSGKGARK